MLGGPVVPDGQVAWRQLQRIVFSSLVSRPCIRLNSVAESVRVQPDEPLDEMTGQQRALPGLRVHPDQRVLGLEYLGGELVAVLGRVDQPPMRSSCSAT